MKENVAGQRKKRGMKKYYLFIVVSMMLSLASTAYLILPAIDQNSMQEYCIVTSEYSETQSEIGKTYVKNNGTFELYSPKEHLGFREFYVQRHDSQYDITESNWISQGRLCKLKTKEVLIETLTFFFAGFAFLFLILWLANFPLFTLFTFFKFKRGI